MINSISVLGKQQNASGWVTEGGKENIPVVRADWLFCGDGDLCIVYQYCIPVPSWKIFHCMDILHFVYPFFDWLTFECVHFYFLSIMSNTAMNICIQVFVWAYVFISPGVEFLDHMVNLCLSFWGTDEQFLKLAVPYYQCAKNVWGFQLYILINTCYCTSFLL